MNLGDEPTEVIDGLLADFNGGAGSSRGSTQTEFRGLGVVNRVDTTQLPAMMKLLS